MITNTAQKQNQHHGCMWKSDNQTLTGFDYKHDTETESAPWIHVEFWQSSTHILWLQTWHRSRMSTMDGCDILTIKHSLPVITNIPQKQNEEHACMWYPDNQAPTSCNHKHCTAIEWAPWMHVEYWKPSTHLLWSQIKHRSTVNIVHRCRILTILYSLPVITNMVQK